MISSPPAEEHRGSEWKAELAYAIGADRIVAPSAGAANYTIDDFKRGADNLREAGEIARPFGVTVMLEFARTSRVPGEGIAPLRRIIEVLKRKKYSGPASFETFNPEIQATDPYQVAMRVRKAMEPPLV